MAARTGRDSDVAAALRDSGMSAERLDLEYVNLERCGRHPEYTTENVLRILICQVLEDASLRGIVVRIDDSNFLRRFVRIDDGPMMCYTTLCNLRIRFTTTCG